MRKLASFPAAGCIGAFLLVACAARPPQAEDLDITTVLQQEVQRHHICDAVVAVVRERRLATVEAASGCPDGAKPSADTVFQAASLSKPVVAYAVMKLVRQGRLQLDAPVIGQLPPAAIRRFDPAERRLGQVTLRMLLNHSSGLPNWSRGALAFGFAPGSDWQYSGEGYVLLQRVVEQLTGRRLDRVIDELVFAPLGMAGSSFVWDLRFEPRFVSGHGAGGLPRETARFERPVAASSLYTTAADYGRFVAALLNDEPLLRLVMDAPVPVDARLGLQWGLGWGIAEDGGEQFLWQWGNNPGYRAFVLAAPARGSAFVLLTDGDDGLKLAPAMARSVLPGAQRVFGFRLLR